MSAISFALAGMESAQTQLDNSARSIATFSASATSSAAPADVVTLSAAMLSLIVARNNFAVSAKVAETANEMQKTGISLLG